MFTGKSPYGWGGWRIPMSRAATDIFADRRKKKSGYLGAERRRDSIIQPFPSLLFASLKRDFPARKVMAAASFGLASIAILIMTGWFASRVIQEPAPPPLKIHARLMEESPLPVLPTVPKKQVSEPAPPPESAEPEKRVLASPPRELPKVVLPEVKILPPSPARPEPVIQKPIMARNFALDRSPAVTPLSRVGKTGRRAELPRIRQPREVKQTTGDSSSAARGLPLPKAEAFSPRSGISRIDLPATTGPGAVVGPPRSRETSVVPGKSRRFSPRDNAFREELDGGRPVGGVQRPATGAGESFAPLPAATKALVRVGDGSAGQEVVIPAASTGGLGSVSPLDLNTGTIGSVDQVRFRTDGGSGDLDPNLIVSLNQLGACVDQAREDRLRTELATLLDRKGQCSEGDMIFFFNYPETGWTMQVDIYNPMEFADKCAALSAAIECVHFQ